MRVRGFVAVGLALVMGAGAISGCTSSSGGVGPRGGGCVPRLTVVPATAHPGEIVTVSSKDVCRDRVPDAGWEVSVTQPIEGGRRVSVRSSDRFDGSWSVPITLPRDFPAGETAVGIDNWDYSFCDDTGSCAAVSGVLQVEAAPTPTP